MALGRSLGNTAPILLAAIAVLGNTASAATFSGPVAAVIAPPAPSSGLPPVEDINGDGIPDLVVVDSGRATVWVYFGAGRGLSLDPAALPMSSYSTVRGATVGDFDGDGVTDIAMAVPLGYVRVFLGSKDALTQRGTGTFSGPFNFIVPLSPVAVAAGPLLGTGNPSGVVAIGRDKRAPKQGEVAVLLGSGAGVMVGPVVTVGRLVRGVVLGDFGTSATNSQRDGNWDIAVTVDAGIAISYGDGAGNFSEPDKYPAGYAPDAVATGDFNNDGCSDLVAMDSGHGAGAVLMLLGRCDGAASSFAPVSQIADLGRGAKALSVTPVNLNGDDKLDLAITRQKKPAGVELLINDFDLGMAPTQPRFLPPMMCPAVDRSANVLAGRFNSSDDAIDDLIVLAPRRNLVGPIPNIAILLGNGVDTSCPIASQFSLP